MYVLRIVPEVSEISFRGLGTGANNVSFHCQFF